MNKERPARDSCLTQTTNSPALNSTMAQENGTRADTARSPLPAISTAAKRRRDRPALACLWTDSGPVWRPRSGTGDSGGQGSAGPRLAGSAHLRSKKAVDGSGLQKRPCREQQALGRKCAWAWLGLGRLRSWFAFLKRRSSRLHRVPIPDPPRTDCTSTTGLAERRTASPARKGAIGRDPRCPGRRQLCRAAVNQAGDAFPPRRMVLPPQLLPQGILDRAANAAHTVY